MIGLIASFFTIIFAYGRNTYSLSRAGYFPKFLSQTHGERKTPHVALIAGAIVGYVVAIVVWKLGTTTLGAKVVAALLNMAVFAAVISYILQMTSFVVLRRKLPEHRATVPEQVGGTRSGDRRRARRDLARRDLPELGVSPGRVRRGRLLRPRASCTSRSPGGTGWCSRRRRSSRSPWARRASPARRGTRPRRRSRSRSWAVAPEKLRSRRPHPAPLRRARKESDGLER